MTVSRLLTRTRKVSPSRPNEMSGGLFAGGDFL